MGKIEIVGYGMSVDDYDERRDHGQTGKSHDINWGAYISCTLASMPLLKINGYNIIYSTI